MSPTYAASLYYYCRRKVGEESLSAIGKYKQDYYGL